MHPPLLQRIRKRPILPAIEVTHLLGGVTQLDIGALLHQLEMRKMLKDSGVRGRL